MTLRTSASAALLLSLSLPSFAAEEAATTPPPDTVELPAVEVVGSILSETDRVTGSAHRVEQKTLEQFKYDDIGRVLNFVPGVYVREEDGSGLRPNIGLRGGSADRSQKVTLMEDGVLIAPAPYSAPAAYFFPLTQRMVGVEVFKGPAAIQHGPQTIGGAVNLISAPIPDKTEAMADAAIGTNLYRRVHLRGGSNLDGLGVLGEYVHIGSDGFKKLDGGGDTGFRKNELLAKAAHKLGPGTLEVRWGYADEVSDETYLGLTEADIRSDYLRRYRASSLDRMKWDWTGGRATWKQPALGGKLEVTGYAQYFDRAWRKFNNFNGANIRDVLQSPNSPFNQTFVTVLQGADTDGLSGSPDDLRIGTNHREFVSTGVQSEMKWAFGTQVEHFLELGGRFHSDRIRRLHDEFAFEQIDGQVIQNNQPRTILVDNTAQADALAIWLRDEMLYGRWTFVPGVRVEAISTHFVNRLNIRSQDNDYVVVLPGLGASYKLTEELSVLAGVHKGFSPATPSLSDDVKPEKAINYEFGGRANGHYGKVELIGFFNDYSNLTATCTISSGCSSANLDTQTNAGKVHAYGLEAGWNKAFSLTGSLKLPVALTYTYTAAEFREAFVSSDPQFGNVQPGFELPYIPPHRANASVGLEQLAWAVTLSATYTDRMRDQAGKGSFGKDEGSDAYAVIDLAGHYRFTPHWSLEGRVDNLLDNEYVVSRRPYGARPGKPISAQLGVTYTY